MFRFEKKKLYRKEIERSPRAAQKGVSPACMRAYLRAYVRVKQSKGSRLGISTNPIPS